MQGKLIIIVGPSASGKTRLVSELLKKIPNSVRLVTTTTRSPRQNEQDKVDFFFVSRFEFENEIKKDGFFESSEVYGNLYGISKSVLRDFLQKYQYVFAIIDVQGAQKLKAKLLGAFTIFIMPGSLDEIKKRLQQERKGIPIDELNKRLETAAQELALANTFDSTVENIQGQFEKAVQKVVLMLKNI